MTYQFNSDQIYQIKFFASQNQYWQAYEYIYTETADLTIGQYVPKPGVEPAAWVWFWGAAAVNKGEGVASDFIRQYTNQQHVIRYGTSLSTAQLDEASNAIAQAVLADIIRGGSLPNLSTISDTDASKSAATYFDGDESIWSGNVLFLGLGHSAPFNETILDPARDGDTYNLLCAIKSTLSAGMAISNWSVSIPNYWAGILPASCAFALNGLSGPIGPAVADSQTALKNAYGGASALLQSIIGEIVGTALGSKLVLGTGQDDAQLSGSDSNELMHGGDGDDRLLASGGNDIMDGGNGKDIADFSAVTEALSVTVKNVTSTANFTAQVYGAGLDSLFGIERIIGSSANDTFAIQSAPNNLEELTLDGGAGDDQLTGVYLDGVTIDTIKKSFNFNGNSISFDNFENYQGSNGKDTFILKGNEKEIDGKGGEDTVDYRQADHGLNRDSSVTTLKDVEIIHGTNFRDTFNAPATATKLYGEAGNDTVYIKDDSAKLTFDGGSGTDVVSFKERSSSIAMTVSNDITSVGEHSFNSVEVYIGTDYNDSFEIDGSVAAVIQGGAGVDQFIFPAGSSLSGIRPLVIWGGAGADEYRFNDIQSGYSPSILHVNIAGLSDDSIIDYEKIVELTKNSIPRYVLDEFENRTIMWERPDIIIVNGGDDKIYMDGRLVSGAEYKATTTTSEVTLNDTIYAGPTKTSDGAIQIITGEREVDGQGIQNLLYHTYGYENTIGSISDGFIDYSGNRIVDGATSINHFTAGGLNIYGYSNGEFGISTTTGESGIFHDSGTWYIEEHIWNGIMRPREIIWDYDQIYKPGYIIEQAFYSGGGGYTANRDNVLLDAEDAEDPLNRIDGSDGDDTLAGSSGDDLIHGGNGDDILLGSEGRDILDGGEGTDWVSYRGANGPVTVVLSNPNFSTGLANQDAYVGIEGFRLTDYSDVFVGTSSREIVEGGRGDDYIEGDGGGDVFVFDKDAGHDVINGFNVGPGGDVIEFRSGIFNNYLSMMASAEQAGPNVAIYFGDDNSILLLGVELNQLTPDNFLFKAAAVNEIIASPEGGYRSGTDGLDHFTGNSGDDTFFGKLGDDLITGGAGSDVFIYRSGDGSDTIDDQAGYTNNVDVLRFTDLNAADLSLTRAGDALKITIASTGEVITVTRQFYSETENWGIERFDFANGTSWDLAAINANAVVDPTGDATIVGTAAAETIEGTGIEDIIFGKGGDDLISGGAGGDVYIYRSGDGNDTIDDQAGYTNNVDVLRFTDLNATDLSLTRAGDALKITIASTGEVITVTRQFYSETENWGIERFDFADGTSWDLAAINAHAVIDPTGDATIIGTAASETIEGTGIEDIIFGKGGDDVISGGAGGDVYIYRAGDGNDTIDDQAGYTNNVDVLRFTDINAADLSLTRAGDALKIAIASTGEVITVTRQFYSETENWGIERFDFADGTSWDLATINAHAVVDPTGDATIIGTAAGDTIEGTGSEDIIFGKGGDDLITGDAGGDVYIYRSGDGNDTIDDLAGYTDNVDVLRFTDLNAADLSLARVGDALKVTIIPTGEVITVAHQFYAETENWGIERFDFADGTSWDLATINDKAWYRGTGGSDAIVGTSWNETLLGNGGDDTLTGGAGNDVFVFKASFGHDTITDFAAGAASDDVIEFDDAVFADLTSVLAAASQVGADTVITHDANNTITLKNVTMSNLHQDDFRFV